MEQQKLYFFPALFTTGLWLSPMNLLIYNYSRIGSKILSMFYTFTFEDFEYLIFVIVCGRHF